MSERDVQHVDQRRRRGFTLIEVLLALFIAGMLGAALAVALDASFMAYANEAEMASSQTSARLVLQQTLTMVRTSSLHDAYDPDDGTVTLLLPTDPNHPLDSPGIQMMLPEQHLVRVFWIGDEEQYGDPDIGTLWYYDSRMASATDREVLLPWVRARVSAKTGKHYVFTLGSRDSEAGLLLSRATMDLTVIPDPDAAFVGEMAQAAGTEIRLIGSATPRKNLKD